MNQDGQIEETILKILRRHKRPVSPRILQDILLKKRFPEALSRVKVLDLANRGTIIIRKDRQIEMAKPRKRTVTFKFEECDGWWCVSCKELPGVNTQGKTFLSALANATDAYRMMDNIDSGKLKIKWKK